MFKSKDYILKPMAAYINSLSGCNVGWYIQIVGDFKKLSFFVVDGLEYLVFNIK